MGDGMMMQTGRKKTVFILAALIVLALGVALVGNTLATGINRENGANVIDASSDYKVDFQYYDFNAETPAYKDAKTASQNDITEGMFWCPGRTEIVYLRLDNQQVFPVEATLSVNVSGSGFGDTLTYAVVTGKAHKDHSNNWNGFYNQATQKGTLKTSNQYTLLDKHLLSLDGADADADECYIAVAIHMDENASNEYKNDTLNISFKLQIDANYTPDVLNINEATNAQKSN